MDKLVLGIIICALFGVWKHMSDTSSKTSSKPHITQAANAAGSPVDASKQVARVDIYTTPYCGYCKQAKEYMDGEGIPYKEFDVENNTENRKQFQALGGRGVPLILVGEEVMHGYNQNELRNMLAKK